ncbi:methylated-DNA--protein-cysteine methyltransferase [Synergistales bacterium]|nr:methylated-DNA--protein-cysteine methyltransferase [Synergistales bacterium]
MNNIASVIVNSPVGELFISASREGLRELSFADRAGEKAESTPATGEGPASGHLNECRYQLEEYFIGRRKSFELEFDIDGTPFQVAVWRELAAIPFGETRSYGEIAERAGKRGAARAVGGANHRNPIAIIIPCHRVIESNGKLGGYGGGLDRKKWLLGHEKCVIDIIRQNQE